MRLTDPGDGSGAIILVTANGGRNRYVSAGAGAYTPPAGVGTTLIKNADGTYSATLADQTTWSFASSGLLLLVTDRYGNKSTLTYNSSSQLTGVSDPASRGSLTLAYNTCFSGRLCFVSDWAGRAVNFGYDGQGRLQTVTDRTNQTTTSASTTCRRACTNQHRLLPPNAMRSPEWDRRFRLEMPCVHRRQPRECS